MTLAVATPPRRPADPVAAYARAVVNGRIVTNRWVRLACERHLDDRRHQVERGLRWDQGEADSALEFIRHLNLPTGQPFEPQPAQAFIIGSLFGWFLAGTHARRFRTAYIEMGKGNGKTPMAAALGILGMVADGRRASEVYTAGVTRDQAHYLWSDAAKMVEASPTLRAAVEVGAHNMLYGATDSYMRPVSSEARSLDQKRVHMALIDEIHEHETPLVVEKMRAGTKGDDTALIVEITNSGYDRTSICWQHHAYSLSVLEGTVRNDSWFAFVCGLDEGDDWQDEAVWPKANPLLDVTVTRRYLREQVQEARDMPAHAALVARLNFCVWTEASAGAMVMERWDACAAAPLIPRGAVVYAGLDLSSTSDMASLVVLYEDEAGVLHVEPRFWCPAAAVEARTRRDHLPYALWAEQGYLTATDGDVIDYDAILADLTDLAARYQLAEVGFLRLNATQFVTAAGALSVMVPISQTYTGMSAATKDWLARIAGSTVDAPRLRHGGHPILRWMAANLVVDTSPTGDMKPSHERSMDRIVGQNASVLALARLAAPHEPAPPEPGILVYWRTLTAANATEPVPQLQLPVPDVTTVAPCRATFRDGGAIGICALDAGHGGEHQS